MVKFGELSDKEKQNFSSEVYKSNTMPDKNGETELWPEDDDSMVKCYFEKTNK